MFCNFKYEILKHNVCQGSLSQGSWGTSNDASAVSDLEVQVLHGGLAVAAINVVTSGSSGHIESLANGNWSIDAGEVLKARYEKF